MFGSESKTCNSSAEGELLKILFCLFTESRGLVKCLLKRNFSDHQLGIVVSVKVLNGNRISIC